jgi:hypothetical protein
VIGVYICTGKCPPPPGRIKYQPMSYEGKNMKSVRQKRGNAKEKEQTGKKKDVRGKKKIKGQIKG